ncbi:dihydrofolate reductase [Jeongeupia naejangsanensis]|uniref:Dihydrofolate reductase n=1 Tax=Jeongeupia naejangsanensis TaxID=613195 RepID=A0ABS2BFP7_9NEIS|nr:dihydrofolate reductase [Jeongeupia naejangsanensis]MBM3114423.1 dihydrofolate reductase [Jeongeupia naejangsanensis]
MELAVIAAMAQNRIIGIDNKLPWHLPEDLKHFKALTMGAPMLMGRKTFESLPGLLPGRRHLVITRNTDWRADGAEAFTSIDAALNACAGDEKAFVIGGGEIYRQALPLAKVLYLTEVALSPAGDATFPEIPTEEWREIERVAQRSSKGIDFAFVTYKRA